MKNFFVNTALAVCMLVVYGCTQTIEVPPPVQETSAEEIETTASETRAAAGLSPGFLSGNSPIPKGFSTNIVNVYYTANHRNQNVVVIWEWKTEEMTTWLTAIDREYTFLYTTPELTESTYYRTWTTVDGVAAGYSEPYKIEVVDNLNPGSVNMGSQTSFIGYRPNPIPSVTAPSGGVGTHTIQWQKNENGTDWLTPGPTWTNISGANSPDYQPPQYYGPPKYVHYRRMVKAGMETKYSNVVAIQYIAPFSAGTIAADQEISRGTYPRGLTSVYGPRYGYNGPPTFDFHWEKSSDGVNWTQIPNTNSLQYQPGVLTSTTYFRRYASNRVNTGYTNVVKITVI